MTLKIGRVFHISFNQVKFSEIVPLKSAVKNAYCACLKGVLPERAGVGVGQLTRSEVPVATTGHIRYVVDVEDGQTGSWGIVNNRPLTHPAEQNGRHSALLSRAKSHNGWRVSL
jgi:hypothetical protein